MPTDPTGRVSHLPYMHRGVSWKQAVRVATTANGTLASAFANASTVDGVSLATGDRILLKNQTAGKENGIYTVNASGAPTRAFDMDQDSSSAVPASEVVGAVVYVTEGTTNANTFWYSTNTGSPAIGTDSLTFAQLTFSLTSPLTTKGDVFGYDTADARIPVGADGTVLTADSAQTLGVKWADPTGGTNAPITAALSNPPTEAELEAAIGNPAGFAGQSFVLTDSDTERRYAATSDGQRFSFAPLVDPTSGTVLTLAAAPSGGWGTLPQGQQVAAYYNGVTYWAYTKGTNGDVAVRSYTHSTGTVSSETVVHAALDTDTAHCTPSLLIRDSDHKIMIFYSAHNGTALYQWVSTSAEDISAGTETNLDSQLGGANYTYAEVMQLLDETNDPIYLFFRRDSGGVGQHWAYSKSTDGGSTWAAETDLFRTASAEGYWSATKSSDSRIDVMCTSDAATLGSNSLYHFYISGGDYFQTDGTQITATLPLGTASLTLVWAGSGDSAILGMCGMGADDNPVLTFRKYVADDDVRIMWSRWDGSSWTTVQVANNGWDSSDGRGTTDGGSVIDRRASNVVWASRNDSGTMHIYRYTTLDNGSTWLEEQITSGTTGDMRPAPVENYAPDLKVIWMHGVTTPPPDTDTGTNGYSA